ncbi:MAG: hypothetical protein HeimC2_30660 [Candidatus Heimdallarchaeota archaeon LC_2]|nr:MAG: hypothetical protein HeimC2_30660 [Candidatus Heimdallarchaeota archaeon LC_2]
MKEALDKWRSRLETVMAETLIYHWINQKSRYGKELISLTQSIISEKIKVPTIYAILNRGKSQGLLEDFVKPDKDKITRGKERKYYRLSNQGKKYYDGLKGYLENASYMQELLHKELSIDQRTIDERLHSNQEHMLYSSDKTSQISYSKQNLVILGYLNLHEFTSIKNINEDLNINYERALQSISVLKSSFEIEIEEKSNRGENLTMVKLTQEQFNLPNLIFEKIDKNIYNEIDGLTSEDVINLKLITGFLLLKQEINGISYLVRYFTDNKIPILSGISYEKLLEYIGIISLNQYLNIQITSEGWILAKKADQTPKLEENTTLPGYDWINYNELIGWLSTRRLTNFKEIANLINNQGIIEFKPNEAPLILSLLVTDGILEGTISDDFTLNVSKVHKYTQEVFLSRNERIMLGYIKSHKRSKINDIADLIAVDNEEIKKLISQIISRSEFRFEIARDGTILIRNLPHLPLLIQPTLLLTHLQELYGYLCNLRIVDIQSLEIIWDKSINLLKSDTLELVGYGLIDLIFDKNKIKIVSKQKTSSVIISQISINQDTLIHELEKHKENKIPILDIANYLDKDRNELIKELCQLVTSGIYPDAYVENLYFVKNGKARVKSQISICENCGAKMPSQDKICSNCNNERWFCIVCRGLIEENEKINSCPNCSQKGHKEHILNWLQIDAKCPACRVKLSINQLEEK